MKTTTHPPKAAAVQQKPIATNGLAPNGHAKQGHANSTAPSSERATPIAFYFMMGVMALALLYFLALPFIL